MDKFEVHQRTKDGFFNATTLIEQWNNETGAKKQISDFIRNQSTQEFISEIISQEKLNTENSPYLSTRGRNGGTWMHPLLFIDFAMWLNARFKYQVLKFVYDQLIEFRHESAKFYLEFTDAVKDWKPEYYQLAIWLNYAVFGKHYADIRNDATQEQLGELVDLQKKLAYAINSGFIKNESQLIAHLKDIYRKKHQNFKPLK